MTDQAMMDQLFRAIGSADWQAITGVVILLAVAIARAILQGQDRRISRKVKSWISAGAATVSGIGALLLAGGVWWQAILIGVLVAPSSSGLWSLIRGSRGAVVSFLLVLAILPATTSCAGSSQALETVMTPQCVDAVVEVVEECVVPAVSGDPDLDQTMGLD